MTLTDQLERLRPLTITQVGELAGYSERAIFNLRARGDRPLSARRLEILAEALSALGEKVDAMIYGEQHD